METYTIEAQTRDLMGRATNALRADGMVPAVVYGFKTDPTNITLQRNALEKLYRSAGESSVVVLTIGDRSIDVLIQDVDRDALTGFLTHADFLAVDMDSTVEATISLEFIGEAPAVKALGGTLVQAIEELEVEALPRYLVSEIEVDISVLATFDDTIHVKDLVIPEGITVLTNGNETIALVQQPRSEAELESLEVAVEADVSAVEVATEKKDTEEASKE